MALRTATVGDVDGVRAVVKAAIESSTDYDEAQQRAWSAPFGAVTLTSMIEVDEVVVAVDGGLVVGFASVRPFDASTLEIDQLYVAPTSQRHGLGRVLVGEMERRARRRGASALRVDASVAATSLLAGMGYQLVETYEKCVRGARFTNHILTRELYAATR